MRCSAHQLEVGQDVVRVIREPGQVSQAPVIADRGLVAQELLRFVLRLQEKLGDSRGRARTQIPQRVDQLVRLKLVRLDHRNMPGNRGRSRLGPKIVPERVNDFGLFQVAIKLTALLAGAPGATTVTGIVPGRA